MAKRSPSLARAAAQRARMSPRERFIAQTWSTQSNAGGPNRAQGSAGKPGDVLIVPLSDLIDVDWADIAQPKPDDRAAALDYIRQFAPEMLGVVIGEDGA